MQTVILGDHVNDLTASVEAQLANHQAAPPRDLSVPDSMELTPEQAARLIGVKPATLRQWRMRDRLRQQDDTLAKPKGPPYLQHTARSVRYPLAELRTWIRTLPTSDGAPQLPDRRRSDHLETLGERG